MANRPKRSRTDSVGLVACLLLAFGTRLAVALSQPDQLTLDRDVYLGIASSIADGRGYCGPNSTAPTAFRPPLYPLSLALGFLAFPPCLVVGGINILAGVMTVWVTANLGLRLQLGRWRFVAALLVAVDPLLLRYSSQPMTESICTLLATFWLWSMIADSPANDHSHQFSGLVRGVSFGLLVLCRPTFWPIAIFCGFGWMIARRRTSIETSGAGYASSCGAAIRSVIGTVVIVAPWLIRNWLVFGVPILTTTHGGYTLLLGNNPVFYEQVVRRPWGTAWPDDSQHAWEADLRVRMDRDLGPLATEAQRDDWQSRQARAYMAAEPRACIEATVHRIRSLWNTIPLGSAADGVNGSVITVVGWFYFFALTFGFIGMIVAPRRPDRQRWYPLYVLMFTVQLVHLFYWTNTRMRAPLTPAIALFAVSTFSLRHRKNDHGVLRE